MKTILVDASFATTSLLQENIKIENYFKKLLSEAEKKRRILISSKFFVLEVANALRFTIKDKEKCLQILKDFTLLPIKTLVLSKNQVQLAVSTSYELGTTVYDTSYHVLAKAHGATFLTCDEDYYKKAKILGDIELIK